jgi:hypothetical protein
VAVCHYHPDRPGVGVCVRCRVVICSDCCTRLDGINHCHACLKKLGRLPSAARSSRALGTVMAFGVLGLAGLFFLGVFWLAQGAFAP